MGMIPIQEAIQRIGKSDSTLRRWKRQGKLEMTMGADGKLYVDEDTIAKHMPKQKEDDDVIKSIVERLDRVEEDIALLRRLVLSPAASPSTIVPPKHALSVERKASIEDIPGDLPPGTLAFIDFYTRHDLDRRQFLGWLTDNHLPHEARVNPRNTREHKRFITPDQHITISVWMRQRGKKFTPCPECN